MDLTNVRQPIDPGQLATIVEAALDAKVGGSIPFTAYDITCGLRQAFPGLEIVHDEVRELVVVGAADRGCDVEVVDYPDGNHARLYTPPSLLAVGATSQTVQKILPVGDGSATPLLPGIMPV